MLKTYVSINYFNVILNFIGILIVTVYITGINKQCQ